MSLEFLIIFLVFNSVAVKAEDYCVDGLPQTADELDRVTDVYFEITVRNQ